MIVHTFSILYTSCSSMSLYMYWHDVISSDTHFYCIRTWIYSPYNHYTVMRFAHAVLQFTLCLTTGRKTTTSCLLWKMKYNTVFVNTMSWNINYKNINLVFLWKNRMFDIVPFIILYGRSWHCILLSVVTVQCSIKTI